MSAVREIPVEAIQLVNATRTILQSLVDRLDVSNAPRVLSQIDTTADHARSLLKELDPVGVVEAEESDGTRLSARSRRSGAMISLGDSVAMGELPETSSPLASALIEQLVAGVGGMYQAQVDNARAQTRTRQLEALMDARSRGQADVAAALEQELGLASQPGTVRPLPEGPLVHVDLPATRPPEKALADPAVDELRSERLDCLNKAEHGCADKAEHGRAFCADCLAEGYGYPGAIPGPPLPRSPS